MSGAVPLHDHAGLDESRRRALAALVGEHTTLEKVLARLGPRAIEEIVAQDEFTHDVLVPWEDGLYLAYDST